ncbi:MAG: YkvA family protein [Bacteroidota bacterium]
MQKQLDQFRQFFSEGKFQEKIRRFAKSLGSRTVYTIYLLYYAYHRKGTPAWAKRIVLGTLGYLIMPIDAIPDLGFLIGFTDDIGVLSFGLVTIAGYVNDEVRQQAREKVSQLFPGINEEDFAAVEKKL